MKPQHKTQFTLAELTQGLDVKIKGDPHCLISGVSTIQQSRPGYITFLMNPIYKKYLAATQAAAVILSEADSVDCPATAVISRDPYFTYAKIAAYFDTKPKPAAGMHPTVVVGENCQIDPSASIGAHCVIGNHVTIAANAVIAPNCTVGDGVEIGEHTCIDANVVLYYSVKLGKRVIIGGGAVIGGDGFGLAKHKGVWEKIPQLGSVIIADDVEIGALCAIDRGAIEDTIIEKGARLDNLIQVGHNVKIGENTAIAGCVGIAGSAVIGKNCLIGAKSGIGGHISLADDVMVTGMSAITKTIRAPGIYSSGVGGVTTNQQWRKNSARLHRLEQLMERVKVLEFALQEFKESKET